MAELKLYRDREVVFKAKIEVKGAKMSETKARLIVNFDDGLHVLYNGKIDRHGNCEIKIPPIKEITDQSGGKAVLEVIADSTLFETWKSAIIVEKFKNVIVEVADDDTKNNQIEIITEVEELPEDKQLQKDLVVKKAIKIFVENLQKNPNSNKNLNKILDKPLTKEGKEWSKRVFKTDNNYTKIAGRLYGVLKKNKRYL